MHLSAGIAKIAADLAHEDGVPPPPPSPPSPSSSSAALPSGGAVQRGDGQLLDESRGQSTGELLIGLSAVCSSFAAATLGLGEKPRTPHPAPRTPFRSRRSSLTDVTGTAPNPPHSGNPKPYTPHP